MIAIRDRQSQLEKNIKSTSSNYNGGSKCIIFI